LIAIPVSITTSARLFIIVAPAVRAGDYLAQPHAFGGAGVPPVSACPFRGSVASRIAGAMTVARHDAGAARRIRPCLAVFPTPSCPTRRDCRQSVNPLTVNQHPSVTADRLGEGGLAEQLRERGQEFGIGHAWVDAGAPHPCTARSGSITHEEPDAPPRASQRGNARVVAIDMPGDGEPYNAERQG
jgi:hypothetical protein